MSSLWNALTGGSKRKPQSQNEQNGQQTITAAPPTPLSSPMPPTIDYTPQGVESFLGGSGFADPAQLHPLAGLNKDTLEYLVLDDSSPSGGQSVIPTRGFFDDMCYGAGVCYLSGLGIGGAWGLREGLGRAQGQPPKLMLNSILNSITRRGPFLGNSAGVVAIIYNSFNWGLGALRGKHDAANTVLAGALSGMLFRSTRGLRPMMISGGVVATAAGAWAITRQTLLPARVEEFLDH